MELEKRILLAKRKQEKRKQINDILFDFFVDNLKNENDNVKNICVKNKLLAVFNISIYEENNLELLKEKIENF